MKAKTFTFTQKNSLKLFVGVFVSVVAMFGLVYVVQNPLFEVEPEAATTYYYNVQVKPTLSKTGCNSKIASYTVYSKWVNADSTSVQWGSSTTSFKKTAVPSSFTHQLKTTYKGRAMAIQTVTAYDAYGKKVGNSKGIGASSAVAAGGTVSRSVQIPCTGY